MSRSKQNKSANKKDADGKHRKETKEERRIRLQKQEEARQVRWFGWEPPWVAIVVWRLDVVIAESGGVSDVFF